MALKVDISWSAPKQSNFKLEASFSCDAKVNALFGPSGSGKSSLLNLIAGLLQPATGEIVVQGETLYHHEQGITLPAFRRRIGYVFQEARLFPHLNVAENLNYAAPNQKSADFSLEKIVSMLEIGALLKRRPDSLSGGERQRVALGRALLSEPRLLLLDEPLAAVEHGLRDQIISFLERIRNELSIPMLYVSHSLEELLQLTKSFIVIEQGKVLDSGSYYSLLKNERIFRLAERLGLINILQMQSAEKVGNCARFAGNEIRLPANATAADTRQSFSLRPKDIIIARNQPEGLSVQNCLPGTIASIVHSEGRVLLRIRITNGDSTPTDNNNNNNDIPELIAEVTPRAVKDLQLDVDGEIYCLFKATALESVG
jgi:molybdate transport system ATP-binding protein